MSQDDLGDRMKEFESLEAGRRLMSQLPICVRIDGRSFSKFTRGLMRPYDERMSRCMIETTKYLVEQTKALIGYTQSDEISLVYYQENYNSQNFFNGKVQKLTSVLASLATVKFNSLLPEHLPEKAGLLPVFDCRVWNVPNIIEAVNTLVWREIDATKNSVSMAARHYFSHNELQDKGRADMMDMLHSKGVNWNDYPTFFKRGTYIQRRVKMMPFPKDKIQFQPPEHEIHTNPDLMVERSVIEELILPPITKIINKVGVILRGEQPEHAASDPI